MSNKYSLQCYNLFGETRPLEVLRSAAGYYIGTQEDGMPYSRDSQEYFASREEAQEALEEGTFTLRLHP